jgi:hypothetical protein
MSNGSIANFNGWEEMRRDETFFIHFLGSEFLFSIIETALFVEFSLTSVMCL